MSKSATSPSPYLINLATQHNNKKNFFQLLHRSLKKQKKKYSYRTNTFKIFSEYIEKA